MSMTSVIIVDDDQVVRQLLTDSIGNKRPDWQIYSAENCSCALELLRTQSFDVVVSDYEMPGMLGDELLQNVASAYPMIVRIMLSSAIEQSGQLTALGVCHNWFAKPCKVDELLASIERSLAVRKQLGCPKLQRALQQITQLPSPPEQYFTLRGLLARDDYHLGTLTQILEKDPALTTIILKLANSSFYRSRQEVRTIEHGARLIGADGLVSLILARGIYGYLPQAVAKKLGLQKLWDHCIAVAELSAELAATDGCSQQVRQECYTAGLVHDIGKIVLASAMTEEYSRVIRFAQQHELSHYQAEQSVLGFTHDAVGGFLLSLWGLPESVVEAVAFHHAPDSSKTALPSPLYYVTLANRLIDERSGLSDPAQDLKIALFLDSHGRASAYADLNKLP